MPAVYTAEDCLCEYLESISAGCSDDDAALQWIEAIAQRTACPGCNSPRKSLYCERCLRLVIPLQYWPVQKPPAALPFALDIVVDDRMTSATGVHYKVLWDALCPEKVNQCRLFDWDRGSGTKLPEYEEDGTYLLFPSEDSVSISSIEPKSKIRRVVVLDCKWARSAVRLEPSIARLPKVHLDDPPKHSQYWRWHNAGEGMLCTIEAIFYTVCHFIPPNEAVHCMWLFAVQKAIIRHKHSTGQVPMPRVRPGTLPENTVPFSMEMKDYLRSLRRQNTAKQKRDIAEQKRNARNSTQRPS